MNDEIDNDWEEMFVTHAAGLPAERMPSPLLEERTVRELRARGLLRRPPRMLPAAWLAGSIAASLALFASGVIVGQYISTRSAIREVAQIETRAAAPVDQRKVALTALHQAANKVIQLAPDDPVAAKILQALEQEQKQKQTPERAGKPAQRQIVWF